MDLISTPEEPHLWSATNFGPVITPFKFCSLAAFNPSFGPPLQLIPYHLVSKDIVQDCVKHLAKIKVMSRLLVLPLVWKQADDLLPLLGSSCLPNQQQCCLRISVPTCCALSYLSYCNCKANKAKKEERRSSEIFFCSFPKCGPLRYPVFPLFHFSVSGPRGLWGQGLVLEGSWNGSCEKILTCKVKWRIWAFRQFRVGMMISRQFAMYFCIIL